MQPGGQPLEGRLVAEDGRAASAATIFGASRRSDSNRSWIRIEGTEMAQSGPDTS